MTTATLDPHAKELDDAFANAMSSPARPRSEPRAPADRDPEAPFGRDDEGKPIAKYGYKNDGTIRLSGAGRPSRNSPDQARVDERPQTPLDGKVVEGTDYTAGLIGTAGGVWLCMTAASKLPLGRLRVGKYGLPADSGARLAAQAFLFDQSKVQLAMALNTAAQHSARARSWAQKLASGDATWALTVASLAGPFLSMSLDLWKGQLDPETASAVRNMAAANDEAMEQVKAQFQAMAEQAEAEAQLAMVNGAQNAPQQAA